MQQRTTSVLAQPVPFGAIRPENDAKFSPNLYAYLRKCSGTFLARVRVFEEADGTQWIGYLFDGDLIGARLSQVLCYGAKVQNFSFSRVAERLQEVEGFWEQYAQDGRCALDRKHLMYFAGDASRWSVNGTTRQCQWCSKAAQRLVRQEVVTHKESWEPEGACA